MVERTKRDILYAFNLLIRKTPMEKLTVEMIAKEADVSKATFYRYYKDKYDVMNDNYRQLLDEMRKPEQSSSYLELFEHLYDYGGRYWKHLRRAFDTTGINSFCDFIVTYSARTVAEITAENRNGGGLTEAEQLQVDVFCIGVAAMYRKWVAGDYKLTPHEAARALYEILPPTLRDLWWLQ